MQPRSREMHATSNLVLNQQPSLVSMQDQLTGNSLMNSNFDPTSSHEDFLDQMFSSIGSSSCSLSDVVGTANPKLQPWELSSSIDSQKSRGLAVDESNPENVPQLQFDDQSVLLSTKLRQHQINGGGSGGSADSAAAAAAKSLLLRQQLSMHSRCVGGNGLRSPTGGPIAGDTSLIHLPLSLGGSHVLSAQNPSGNVSIQALYNNGFTGSLLGSGQSSNQFHQVQDFGAAAAAAAAVMNASTPSSSSAGGGNPGQPRQRVRARRGQATDPHSIAERLRRERIAERMKALQELVPNGNKSDKASMLDEIIDYVKFLQLQVKVLSMSRLGGAAAAVTPIVADISSEARGGSSNGGQHGEPSSTNDSVTVTENQVVKLMEEDMGSAMQYLQGKGLCLMPISLATAISTATCHSRNPMAPPSNVVAGPLSPNNVSGLTVQSSFKKDVHHG